MFFEVNSVQTDKRVPSILTLMHSEMYALLRSISAPRKPKELNFTEIVDTLALWGGSVAEWFRALSEFVLGSPEFNSSTAMCK